MRRLAIFVEGHTELLFIDRLISEIAEINCIAIQHRKIIGGGRSGKKPRTTVEIRVPSTHANHSHYLLIVDCGGDDLVAKRIREEHPDLTRSGYEKVIGIRDVFPKFTKAEIPKLRQGLRTGIRTSLAPVEFVLSIMEIEAWFLAEHNHFQLIDPAISVAAISQQLGFNPESDDASDRVTPTLDLVAAYGIGGMAYVKGDAQGTIDKLDYVYLYEVLRQRIPDLAALLRAVDDFLT